MNKHLLFVILLLLVVSSVFAQPGMQGMRISSNGGTISGLENPALLANVKNRWDVSLFGLNYTIENSDLKINWRDIMNGEDLKFNAASFKNIDNFSLSNVVEIQGPSAMFSLKNKLAVGFTTRVRSFTQLRSLNFSLASPILEGRDFDIATDGKIVEPYMNINLQSFADIGVSGAYKVLRIKKHNLFVGATARMYKGIFALDFTGENINMDLNQINNDSILNVNANFSMQASVPVGTDFFNGGGSGFSDPNTILNTVTKDAAGSGFGFDVGVVYEGEILNRKLRAGLSINDMGNIKYNKGKQYGATFIANNVVIHKDSLDNFPSGNYDSIKAYAAKLGILIDTTTGVGGFTQTLPTQINLFADMQIVKGFYVSMMTAFDATSDGKPYSNYANYVSIIPRFQSKRLEAWVPMTYNGFSRQAKFGLGARFSALYFGSNNVSDLLAGEVKGVNFYIGARVSSLRSKKQDEVNKGNK